MVAFGLGQVLNVGLVVSAVFVVVIAGLFTIRSNVGKIWKEQAEALQGALIATKKERDEQRERAHSLKSELAAERMKTDVTGVLSQMQQQHNELLQSLAGASGGTVEALVQMEERLTLQNKALLEMIGTQTRVLNALADRIAEKVGEKVGEAVGEQLDAQTQQIVEAMPTSEPDDQGEKP